jgi:hypothetical protein
MSQDFIRQLDAAIERARAWAQQGWQADFGPGRAVVASLEEALRLPSGYPCREEALAYWRNVQCISEVVVRHLEGARSALQQGDRKGAGDKLYFAQYFEKPLEKLSQTSGPVYEGFKRMAG